LLLTGDYDAYEGKEIVSGVSIERTSSIRWLGGPYDIARSTARCSEEMGRVEEDRSNEE